MRKVCVVTATRAEYGALRCLLGEVQKDPELELQLISTGSHLSHEFGYTQSQIEDDGFKVIKKIEILLSSDSPVGVSKAMGLAQISFAEAFEELEPDILIIVGDRYELLPIVSAANIARIPVAHISGGELTEGAVDDQIRHAVTKLANVHFTAMEEYSNRVIQMGEQPSAVFTVGEIGLDNLLSMKLLDKREFEDSIGRQLKKHNLLFTYHPVTSNSVEETISEFKAILSAFDRQDNTLIIFTKSNADVGGRAVNQLIDEYCDQNKDKAIVFSSLGQLRYLSALQFVDAVVGNSSSGIWEVPSFKTATINIGDRQKGRVIAENTININASTDELLVALNKVYSDDFTMRLANVKNPYGDGNSSGKVIDIIKSLDLKALNRKKFYDIDITSKSNSR
ncbi:UDP-N-acetylglucosamine 2-epimerase (hydrolyzing) [Vibrio sp. T187]|uniref:UDP-N-acetylglucosamine 2-epimerase n=1 Tax=Vibrio TaxID=662 RepID=UPI0010C96F77|nr:MULTISPECIES: UDP-N-acetylglucosamine 2-epimerase [Vibrio]MBW3697598.1 UDP-N-acetylglucosamine 2-epimerase (hydrolyzing) [Vibrio sp. T187]